jgi:hypothetical protein
MSRMPEIHIYIRHDALGFPYVEINGGEDDYALPLRQTMWAEEVFVHDDRPQVAPESDPPSLCTCSMIQPGRFDTDPDCVFHGRNRAV